jgi:hypothetical protein
MSSILEEEDGHQITYQPRNTAIGEVFRSISSSTPRTAGEARIRGIATAHTVPADLADDVDDGITDANPNARCLRIMRGFVSRRKLREG